MRFSVMLEVCFFAALQVLLFSMVQGTSCQPSCILVSNTTDILMVDPKTSRAESVVSNLHRAVALDVDVARGYIYWSDVIERAIRRARINGSDMEVLFALDVGICDGLALDWVSGLLYWSDTTYDVIEVASVYTPEKARRVLINDGLERPRGIAIAPNDRFMFWTDWGRVPKIERSFLNGDGRKTIVSSGLVWPNDVTVDLTTRKIFWVESYLDKIETADYDGNGRTALLVYAGRLHPFSLIFHERIIYWTDWAKTEGLYSLNTSNNQVSSINLQGSRIMGVAIFNQTSQPSGRNPCGGDNGGCSHLCLAKSVGVQCACPTGLALLDDTRTCKKDFQHFLLFADANSRTMNVISLDVNYFARSTVFRYLGVQKPTAIDYDPVEDRIYWTDPHQHWIARAFRNASWMEILYNLGIGTPYGLAFDWIGRNIYWTDNGTDSIIVGKLDGSAYNSLITEGLSDTMDIVVNPRDGEMYWTDWGGIPRIEKASMNGSLRRIIVNSGLLFPNALDIDLSANKLYWTDIGRNYIEQSDLDGRNRRVLLHAANIRPFGMAQYQGYLYWTDWSRRAVLRLNISSGENITVVVGLSQPMDIQAYYPGMRSASTALLCSPLTGLEYVQVTPDKCQSRSKPGTVCVFSCPRGFTLRGTQTRTCGPRGIWSGKNDTSCQVVTCPTLRKPENGDLIGCLGNQAPQFNTSCNITCNQGYQLSGSSVRRCLENGEWSGTDTRCTVVTCPTLRKPENGDLIGCLGNRVPQFNTSCNITCNQGYQLSGSSVRRCLENGEWSGTDTRCTVVTCPTLRKPENGDLIGCLGNQAPQFNTSCNITCNQGYQLSGSSVRRCLENGEWSGTDSRCTGLFESRVQSADADGEG